MPSEHYFSPTPSVPSRPSTVEIQLDDLSFSLATDRGVFSQHQLDPGTKLLLQNGPRRAPSGPVLDLGCGYGPIAATLAQRWPRTEIVGIDVNDRALDLTRHNLRALGCTNAIALRPEEVPPSTQFSAIWSNPPIRIGKTALHDLLGTWLDALTPDGSAHLVVAKNLGADSLATWLRTRGWEVNRRVARLGYRVLDLRRDPTAEPH